MQPADVPGAFDEATVLTLRLHPERARTFSRDGGLAVVIDDELSLAVLPDARGHGVGTSLVEEVLREVPTLSRVWSHEDHPAAAALAAKFGFKRERELWVMRRPLSPLVPAANPFKTSGSQPSWSMVPPGFTIRPYGPADAAELLRVNAAAFAEHPEQGGMDSANLADRMSQDWFDPNWLLTAWRATQETPKEVALAGFHWVKRHSPTEAEVYVIAVDPAAQGSGLGGILLDAGLALAAGEGATSIHLYVESDNPAVHLYERNGFTHVPADTHVQYVR